MVHPQRTCSHMELLPLVCLCLLSCSGTTSADPAGTVVVKQDDDVILPCSIDGVNMETVLFDWKKDGQTKKEVFLYNNGDVYHKRPDAQDPQFRGRVSHFQEKLKHGNASIKIRNARMDDSGDYTCDFPRDPSLKTVHVKLVVDRVLKVRPNVTGAAPKPSVTSLDVTENSALLQCEAHGVPDLEVHWQDSDGNKLPAEKPQVTERGGLSYITLKTTVTKTDNFSCVATQKNISHRISAEIFVRLPGAASKPSVTKHKTQDGVLLLCVVQGASPKPKVEWKDSSGKNVAAKDPQVTESGGSYDIILKATVTKTDNYHCVVTQEEIGHNSTAEIYALVNGSESVSPLDGLLLLQFLLLFLLL